MSVHNIQYKAIPSLQAFHASKSRVRVVRGPIGSGKTTAMIMDLLKTSINQKPDPNDGIRRTRHLVTRNTLPQLKQTCLASIMHLLRPIAQWRPSDSTVRINFNDVESEWLLLPLDSEQNIQRLLSLELTTVWASEAREIRPDIIMNALSRTGRYPSMMVGGPSFYGLVAESNSFRVDSPWFDLLENERPSNWEYFVQPGARSPEADWLQYLVPTYYEDLIASNTEEWVHQYVDNEYGDALDGQAVYRNSFDPGFHIAETRLNPVPMAPIIVGMDFARWPAAIFCQVDNDGRLLILDELERENCGVEKFATENVLPLIHSDRYRGRPAYVIGDPSGVARSQIGEEDVFSALRRLGFPAYPATTNQITPRLRAVEKFLLQQRKGKAAFLVSPHCKQLIEGFRSKYRFKIKKTGEFEDKPDKIRPWADLHDALQYACLGTNKTITRRAMTQLTRDRNWAPPRVSSAAWT